MVTDTRGREVRFKVIDSTKRQHLYFAQAILLFYEHFRKLPRPQKIDSRQPNFSFKDTSTCENMSFFYAIAKEKLTGLGAEPRINELQRKPRVGTEGMQGIYSDRECFVLSLRVDGCGGSLHRYLNGQTVF